MSDTGDAAGSSSAQAANAANAANTAASAASAAAAAGQQMSQQQRQELSVALHDIGCPEGEVLNNPLDWESISYLLEHFTAMDESSRLEARRRYEAFINQPLRARQKKAMQHLIDLLRNTQAGATTQMEVEAPELASTPIP